MEIFISHSSKDADIAEAMIDLLRAALNLSAEEIRCTSVNGYRLPTGASTEEQLRQEIHESRVLIGLITPASLTSHYVLFELGARWGAGNFLAPVLAAGADSNRLPGPLTGRNAINCNSPGQIHQLVDDLAARLGRRVDDRSSILKHIDKLVELSKTESELSGNEKKSENPGYYGDTTRQPVGIPLGLVRPKFEINTNIVTIQSYDQLVHYDLHVALKNISEGAVSDYRIEVEFPWAFLNQSTIWPVEVAERRTETHWLFRMTNKHHNNHILYPGDSLEIFSIDYQVTADIARSEAMKEAIRIKAFAGDEIVRQVILPMREAAKFFGQ